MTSIDRRTFLVNGVRTTAAVAAAGVIPAIAVGEAEATPASATTPERSLRAQGSDTSLTASGLTVNGLTNPIGVDPDACFFAWVLHASGRGARQTGYRITVRRTDPLHAAVVWDSGMVTCFEAYYHDVVPEERLVYTYTMHLDERKISVSLATFELKPAGAGTRLVLTEQGAFLDGYDDAGARERGTNGLLDALGASLKS